MKKFLALACALLLAPQWGFAQQDNGSEEQTTQPPAPMRDDGPVDQASENIPALPPTVVTGERFPAEGPLGEDVVFTPQRTATPASNNASSITVITREEIQQKQQTSVVDVLRDTVGLDVSQSGGVGRLASVFIRGANSEHTKILLDGIPLNNAANFSRGFDFSTLTVDNIERIEVLRGPQSLVYGSDAIGGVVNIITKRGDGPTTATVNLMGGSFGTHREGVNVSGGNDQWYYSVGGSYFDTEGISAVSQRFGGVEQDGYQNTTLSGRFGWTPTEALNVDYVFRYINAEIEVDDFLLDNPIRDNQQNQFFQRVQLQSSLLDGMIQQTAGFSLNHSLLEDPLGFTPRFEGQTRQFDYQANLSLFDNECYTNTLTVGADYLHEEATSTGQSLVGQNLAGVYVQDTFSFWDRSFTTIGVRWDDHSNAGAAQTYRFTQLFRVDETGTSFRGTIGRGFRAPSLFQQLPPFGNPVLQSEFSQGWDVGVEQSLFAQNMTLGATYYRNDFENLIIFDFPTSMTQNVGVARTSGVEFTMQVRLTENTRLNSSYTYLLPRDLSSNRDLLRRARHKANLSLHHTFCDQRASLGVYMLYVGPRTDIDDTFAATTLDEYFLVNPTGTYRLTERIELFGRVDNLFGENYEEVFGFGTPGISFFGGARITL